MKALYTYLAALVLLIPSAQSQQVSTNGTPTFNSFGGGPDLINEGNLNVHYSIPVFSRAGRGLPFSYSIPVDSSVWYRYLDVYANPHWGITLATAQPSAVLAAMGGVFHKVEQWPCRTGTGPDFVYKDKVTSYTDTGDSSHPLSAWIYDDDCLGRYHNQLTSTSGDGSGISIAIAGVSSISSVTVTLANGTVVKPPLINVAGGAPSSGNYTTTDTNGNRITVNTNGNQINYILDTLGTQALTSTGGPPPTAVTYKYTAPSGAQAPVTITYKSVTIQSAWGCTGVAEYPATSGTVIDKITLPDGTYYQFSYEKTTPTSGNTTARISQVRLPTGGTITYNYAGGDTGKGIVCADGSTAGFDRVSTQSGTVQYRRTINTISPTNEVLLATTRITDADSPANVTVVDFYLGFETQRKRYQGAASGTPLETMVTCYNGTDPVDPSSNCPTAVSGQHAFSRISTFRSLNGGPYARHDTFYNGYGLVTKTDDYDWGASSYTRETQTAFDTTLGSGIVDHPSSVKVYDGAMNLKAQTDFSYDDFGIQGDTITCAPATKCRGNLTKVTNYSDAATTFTAQMTYNITGTVATSLDPNGATTTYTYGSGGCNSAFPTQTQVTFGPTTLTTSATYNCTGAVVTSSTDANSKTTSMSYTDAYFWRPASTTDQLNNVTSYTYTGTMIVESAMNFNANRSTVDFRSTRDTFGRPVYTQKRQGYNNSYYDTVQQLYDTVGRPFKTSMPYQGTAGQAPGSGIYTQATYDAMGRVTRSQDAAGGILNMAYSQNDVYQEVAPIPSGSTENTKRKQLEYDGLGRLTSVCEITNGSNSGSCGQVTGGYSGYLTTYVYGTPPYVNSLTVTQNGQPNGGTAQSRTYRYDMLGRMTYESNPETGVNQYFYDSLTGDQYCGTVSSPGDLVKTVDNQGLVSCLTYDGLHRVLSISYPNAPANPATPSKKFVYESAVVNGTTMSLTAGRLAEAYTCTTCSPTPTKLTDLGFSYSERGQLKDVYESTPHSGTYYHISADYWEHAALKSLGILNIANLPTVYYGGSDGSWLDGEGRFTRVSTSASQYPTLASGVIYTTSGTTQPIGSLTSLTFGSGDSDTFGYDTLTGRLRSYDVTMNGSAAKSATLTWNANGSLGRLWFTDYPQINKSTSCSYSHDDLGRISSSNCVYDVSTVWNQTFTYDPFGNIRKDATAGITFTPTYDPATNRIASLPGCTPTYDASGNLTNDCSHIYTWQADNAVASVDTVSLTYDALGRVVEQARGSNYTQIVYAPDGSKLALMNGTTVQKAFFPLPGGGAAVYNSSGLAYFRHADWLGSSWLATTPSAPTSVYARSNYAPYGEPWGVSGTSDFSFTGQNQDTVSSQNSGLYDFLFREYNPQHGRWISPDPAGMGAAGLAVPQSWNRYTYITNMPLSGLDSFGLWRDVMEVRGYSQFGQTSLSPTYYLNGMQISATMAMGLLSMGAAISCGSDCNQFINGQATVGSDNQIYRWTPGDQPTNCYPGDGGYGGNSEYNCPAGPWTLKPTHEYVADTTGPANNGPIATIGPPEEWHPATQTSAVGKYITEYAPCAVGEGVNRWWGRNANVPGSVGSNAAVTVAVHIAPIAKITPAGRYMPGSVLLYLAGAAAWDISNAFAVRQTCTQSVYGGG